MLISEAGDDKMMKKTNKNLYAVVQIRTQDRAVKR